MKTLQGLLFTAYTWIARPYWCARTWFFAFKRRSFAWLGKGTWAKSSSLGNVNRKKRLILEQVGCWGTLGLLARRYHRPPFVLILCATKRNFAFNFSREPISAHPKGVSLYLLPSGLTGWMWRFWLPTILLASVSFWAVHPLWAFLAVFVLTGTMLVIVYALFYSLSFPVLSSVWKRAIWTNRFDRFFYGLFSHEMGTPNSYKRKHFCLQLLYAMRPLPSNNSPHSILFEMSPYTAILRAAIMDMLSTDFEGPAPLWCGHPVIRWILFWLYPVWIGFILLVLWLCGLIWIKNGGSCSLNYFFSQWLNFEYIFTVFHPFYYNSLVFSVAVFLAALGVWFVCTVIFLMRMGRYLRTWLVMPQEQMHLLLPLISVRTPQLRDNAIFLEDKATTQILIIVASLCSAILGALVELFLDKI